ncbi:MAG: enoyl-CoA hydratase/isomerase family protein [Myxococcales bacterium]|nr:enoyl-CoA hydratase/isomerase family protein [Myxococcales bacterium]MCB1741518.1 enoyl-CoA hydratase/isomerase family protein [Gammaproteobacteria bacterium]
MAKEILVERDGRVAHLILNRPEVLNALNAEMATALRDAALALGEDPAVRCVVVRGAGEHFMAGGDIAWFRQLGERPADERRATIRALIGTVHEAIRLIRSMPKPVVASARGGCAGFGLSLLSACDLALVADKTTLSLAYCKIGASPDGGSTYSLPRAIGLKQTMALALLGDRVTPEQALSMGLVNEVVPVTELERRTQALAERLARGPRETLARTKQLVNQSLHASLADQLLAEQLCFVEGAGGDEFLEGVRAFMDKRAPDFG